MKRWDQSELARRASTSPATISQIETGRTAPTAEQVEAIGAALGYSAEFLTAQLRLAPTTRPWLRAYADASRKDADARLASATIAGEYIRRLKLSPLQNRLPVVVGDPEDDDAIEELALESRLLADIDEAGVVGNAIRAAERLGCIVLPLETELGRHLGMSVRADDLPMIFVTRENAPGDRQRFSVAHEIGHLVLHRETPPPQTAAEAARLEKQAHRFAAAFLAPAEPLIDTLDANGGRVTLRALAEIKSVWGVAIKALVHRFQELGVIDPDQARSLYKQISARKWNKHEPVEVPLESAQWFERTLLRASGSGDLSAAAKALANRAGGNSNDLLTFADWTPSRSVDAEVISLTQHRRLGGRPSR